MDLPSFNILSLCSGIGGLDLGLHIAREDARTVCYVEREAFAAEVLAEKIEQRVLPDAPIYSDLSTFDGKPWRGVVDCVTAGLPCQPFSVAGKRRGEEDERYLWGDFFRILDEVRPALAFLENVPGLFQFFRSIGEELCRMGYEFEAGLFTAAEVGAPHKRERVFILAHTGFPVVRKTAERQSESPGDNNPHSPILVDTDCAGLEVGRGFRGFELSTFPPGPSSLEWPEILREWPELAPAVEDAKSASVRQKAASGADDAGRTAASRTGEAMADAPRDRESGRDGERGQVERIRADGEELADTYRSGRQQESRGAPGDEEADGRAGRDGSESDGNYQPERSRSVAVAEEEAQPAVRAVAGGPEPVVSRIDSLRASGNAVVPLQAAFAFEILSRKIGSCL